MKFDDDNKSPFCERIASEAIARDIDSPTTLEKVANLPKKSILRLEASADCPSQAKTLLGLAKFFNKSLDWVVFGEEKENYSDIEKELINVFRKLPVDEQLNFIMIMKKCIIANRST